MMTGRLSVARKAGLAEEMVLLVKMKTKSRKKRSEQDWGMLAVMLGHGREWTAAVMSQISPTPDYCEPGASHPVVVFAVILYSS